MDFSIAQTQEIHHRVSALAKKKFKRMKDFYEASEVSSPLFSQYKTGKTPTSMQAVNRMADAVGIDVADLLDGIDQIKDELEVPPAAVVGNGLSDKDSRLIAWFRSLPPEKQKAILVSQDAPEGLV